jgi:hypothetical protein
MFDIRDKDGWTGVEAETLDGARLACETIAREGYDLPLAIVPDGIDVSIMELVDFDERGAGIWKTNDLLRKYEGRAA